MAKKKNSLTSTIAGILSFVAVGLGIFLKNFDDYRPGWGRRVFILVCLLFATALILWGWEKNRYRFNMQSIPEPLKIIGSIFLFIFFILGNLMVCRWRLDVPNMSLNLLPTILTQILVLLIGAGLHLGSYFRASRKLQSKTWIISAMFLSMASVFLLNSLFSSNIGDLTTTMKPTKRCFSGGTCYAVGMETWGGLGTTFLMAINLLQGILILNAISGIYFLSEKIKRSTK